MTSKEVINTEIRLTHADFKKCVRAFMQINFQKQFEKKELDVGVNITHEFDLVSDNNEIVVKCKSCTWTKNNNLPMASISKLLKELFYFSIVKAKKKILVFQDHINEKGESLAEVFIEKYNELLDDIEVWIYDTNNVKVEVLKEK